MQGINVFSNIGFITLSYNQCVVIDRNFTTYSYGLPCSAPYVLKYFLVVYN